MKTLRISTDLVLPLDAVTQKLAWMGRTGSGKTFGCKRMVEQMLHAGAQVVILDGAGGWPGLRLGPKSFDIPVLGGLYGDIPLEPTAGALVADIIVDRGTSIVIDVSQMLDSERTRFATAFGQRFFQRKKASPGAVHLVLEECQDYIPENQQRGEERMLHEFQRIAKQGRPHGIGVSFLSQRPQEVSKKALNQAECVFAFQMTGPQERKALQYWLSDKGFDGKLADILPTLEVGAPHVWSPQWLKISKVVRILPIESLDTSQTPKVGVKAFSQKKLQPIDLTELSKAMVETIERAKADDPKALRAEIAKLRGEIAKKPAAGQPPEIVRVEVPVFDRKLLDGLHESVFGQLQAIGGLVEGAKFEVGRLMNEYRTRCATAAGAGEKGVSRLSMRPPGIPMGPRNTHHSVTDAVARNDAKRTNGASTGLPKAERQILATLVQHGTLSLTQAAMIAGYSAKSGGMRNAAGSLRSLGYIDGGNDAMTATPEGLTALGPVPSLPVGPDLATHWYGQLPKAEREILAVVVQAYPRPVSLSRAAEECGYSVTSGGIRNAAGKLRTLMLVTGGNDGMTANERLVHG